MSFSDELPNPTLDLAEGKELQTKRRPTSKRLSMDMFKFKQQYYDRRPSSMDASTWYSGGSSISVASTSVNSGLAAATSYAPASGSAGLLKRGSILGHDEEEDRDEVTYSPARLSLIAGTPSPACGSWNPSRDNSDAYEYGGDFLHMNLFEKLYKYGSDGNLDFTDMNELTPIAEDILLASEAAKIPRNTSIFRSFEGWGFNADELNNMDSMLEDANRTVHRFDSSISESAHEMEVSAPEVDPLDRMDTSRTLVESHPLPVPPRAHPHSKRGSASLQREIQRRRRLSSLQSLYGPGSRQHSLHSLHSSRSPSIQGPVPRESNRDSFTSSPYRPSIVLTEIPIFDMSESEPPTRNVSLTGSIYGNNLKRNGSVSFGTASGRRKSSVMSNKKSVASSQQNLIKHKIRTSLVGLFSSSSSSSDRKEKPKTGPDVHFVPLLQEITEVSSQSSREQSPELEIATAAPIAKIRKASDGKPRMLPIRTDYQMRRASFTLQLDDDEIYDPVVALAAHQEHRRSSSVYDNDSMQPGEQESPPLSPSVRRYSMSHMSHPETYTPPRANWYKSSWGLDENKKLDSDARSISSKGVGAVRAVLSRQSNSRRGSMDGPDGLRKLSAGERMEDLSYALREALKMNEMGILEESSEMGYA